MPFLSLEHSHHNPSLKHHCLPAWIPLACKDPPFPTNAQPFPVHLPLRSSAMPVRLTQARAPPPPRFQMRRELLLVGPQSYAPQIASLACPAGSGHL